MIAWVGVPAALLFSLLVALSAWRGYEQMELNAERGARAVAREHAAIIEGFLRQGERIARMMASQVSAGQFTTDEALRDYMRSVLEGNAGSIYGSCVAFRPNGFQPDLAGYAPYFYRTENGLAFENLAKPDYNYLVWDWYRVPRDTGQPAWSEPYFDDGGGQTLMTTYSVPLRKDGAFWGIVTIDIALRDLLEAVRQIAEDEALTLGEGCYAVIVSKSGKFLAFPGVPYSHVMERSLGGTNPELAAEMKAGHEGVMQTSDPRDGKKAWVAYAPILFEKEKAGAPEMALGIVSVKEGALNPAKRLLTTQIALGVISLAVLFLAITLVARSVSRPLRELVGATRRIAQGDLEVELHTGARTISEVRDLTAAFKKMTRDLRLRMQELERTIADKEHLEGELSAARSIQMSLLPKKFPAFPERPEIDVHAIVQSAREVGGDFYDFFRRSDGRLCFVMGDVSGKGAPAALFMALTKALVKAVALSTVDLAEIMRRVNAELCEDAESGMFVTLVVALLDPERGGIEVCNAGHIPPLILGADGSVSELAGVQCPALALSAGVKFSTSRRPLPPGSALFFSTDGVTEALDPDRRFFGEERLRASLEQVATEPADRITSAVVRDVQSFCGAQDQADDITVMCLRWLGAASIPREEEFPPALIQEHDR